MAWVPAVRFAFLVLCALLIPPATAMPFLQHQADAARTGQVLDSGPLRLDAAFEVELPGLTLAPPIIIGEAVFVLLRDSPPGASPGQAVGGPSNGIWHVDLRTAETSSLVHTPSYISGGFASDGYRLFFVAGTSVHAYNLDGTATWPEPTPLGDFGMNDFLTCPPGAFAGDELILACTTQRPDVDSLPFTGGAALVVVRVDSGSGALRGSWRVDFESSEIAAEGLQDRVERATGMVKHLAVGPDYVAVAEDDVAEADDEAGRQRVWILGRDPLELRGLWISPAVGRVGNAGLAGDTTVVSRETQDQVGGLVAAADRILINTLELFSVDPTDASTLWRFDARHPSAHDFDDPGAVSLLGSDVIAQVPGGLVRLNSASTALRWTQPAPVAGDAWLNTAGLLSVGDKAYMPIWGQPGIIAVDLDSGEVAAHRPVTSSSIRGVAVGEGVAVVLHATTTGSLERQAGVVNDQDQHLMLVLGSPPAAIGLDVKVGTIYPDAGETVRLDLGIRPGVLDPDWQATVDWGDGTIVGPVTQTSYQHAYATEEPRHVLVQVTNNAGQEASWEADVLVGQEPGDGLNFLQVAFAQENLDTTWGVIGLAVVALGALVAAWKRRRHHSLLANELEHLRVIRAVGLDDPARAARELDAFEGRIGHDLARRRVTDAQFAVLVQQAGEVRRVLRKRAVAPLAGLVSPAFRTALDAALEDGRITSPEATALRRALRDESRLGPDGRRQVLAVIDGWQTPP